MHVWEDVGIRFFSVCIGDISMFFDVFHWGGGLWIVTQCDVRGSRGLKLPKLVWRNLWTFPMYLYIFHNIKFIWYINNIFIEYTLQEIWKLPWFLMLEKNGNVMPQFWLQIREQREKILRIPFFFVVMIFLSYS